MGHRVHPNLGEAGAADKMQSGMMSNGESGARQNSTY